MRRNLTVYLGWPTQVCPHIQPNVYSIEGFHVTSLQAIFASHHTRDRHVGFIFTWSGIGKYNKTSWNFLFDSYHGPNYKWVTRISAYTLGWNFNSFRKVYQKFKRFFVFFFSILRHTERKPSGMAKSCIYRRVPCHANLLLCGSVLRFDQKQYLFKSPWCPKLIHLFCCRLNPKCNYYWSPMVKLWSPGSWGSHPFMWWMHNGRMLIGVLQCTIHILIARIRYPVLK